MIKGIVKSFASKQFMLFVIFSGIAAIVNAVSRIGIQAIIGSYDISLFFAYLCGMATAFTLNRVFCFTGSEKPLDGQIKWFVIVNIFGVLQTYTISKLALIYVMPAIGVVKHAYFFSHMLGIGAPAITSFLGHRYLTFGRYTIREIAIRLGRKEKFL